MNSSIYQRFCEVPGIEDWEYDNGNESDAYWVRSNSVLRITVCSVNFETWNVRIFINHDTYSWSGVSFKEVAGLLEIGNNAFAVWAVHSS